MTGGVLGGFRRRLLALTGLQATIDIVRCHYAVGLPSLEQCLLIETVCHCTDGHGVGVLALRCALVQLLELSALLLLFASCCGEGCLGWVGLATVGPAAVCALMF